ncbi:hypothetical protein BKA63DRAFT_324194 [Paraphoma chrysanthemicola]|nr:hypothetical protein BKA63DRAFT_324194 [Paraphoma chrysanthemicola]
MHRNLENRLEAQDGLHNSGFLSASTVTFVLIFSRLESTFVYTADMLPQRSQINTIAPQQRLGVRPNVIPQAPRAMQPFRTPDSVSNRVQVDVSKKLYPRLVLFQLLAMFKDKRKLRQESNDPICNSRRDFLDSFAYLCDTEKGGKTVTATALQSLSESDLLWLAANEGVRDDVYSYAKTLLQALKTVSSVTVDMVKSRIFSLAVEKCRPRNRFYRDKVQKLATNCRMQLRESADDFLEKRSEPCRNLNSPCLKRRTSTLATTCVPQRLKTSRNSQDLHRMTAQN